MLAVPKDDFSSVVLVPCPATSRSATSFVVLQNDRKKPFSLEYKFRKMQTTKKNWLFYAKLCFYCQLLAALSEKDLKSKGNNFQSPREGYLT